MLSEIFPPDRHVDCTLSVDELWQLIDAHRMELDAGRGRLTKYQLLRERYDAAGRIRALYTDIGQRHDLGQARTCEIASNARRTIRKIVRDQQKTLK